MKKNLILFAIIPLLTSCTNGDIYNGGGVPEGQVDSPSSLSSIRSMDEALAIAQQSLALIEGHNTRTGGISRRQIDVTDGIHTIVTDKTRGGSGNDTLLYIFNFEDDEGFSVVAAPRSVEGILAVTERGHFDPDNSSGIGGFDYFMESAEQYVLSRIREPFVHLFDSVICVGHDYVGPYVSVRWGQTLPEGEFCPNGISGCTNTAMAQIMSYYEYPGTVSLTYPEADKTSQQLDWTAMKNHATGHNLYNCTPEDTATHASIGRLLRQLGYMNNSSYNPSSTGTQTTSYAQLTLSALGYQTSSWMYYNESFIQNNISNGIPMLIIGHCPTVGHAWVVDGYDIASYQLVTFAQLWNNIWIDSESDEITLRYLYHFNWGWYGINNGYFNANVFNTAAVQFPDTSNNSASYNFNTGVSLLSVWR